MSDVRSKIRQFLSNDLEVDVSSFSDSDELFTGGLIDSFALIELLGFLESELDFTVNFAEMTVDDFDTIDSLVKLVEG
ncbi:MAG: acyl carrier protein [Flavobacteriales bacterium]